MMQNTVPLRAGVSKIPESSDVRGWVLYDGHCPICRAGARRLACIAGGRGYRLRPLQLRWVQAELDTRTEPIRDEMLLLLPDGRLLGGVDVYTHLGFRIWWAWPLAAIVSLPGIHWLAGKVYAWIAANRYRFTRACEGDQCRVGH